MLAGKTGTAENAHGRDRNSFVPMHHMTSHKLLWLPLLNKVALVQALQVQSYEMVLARISMYH